MTKMSNEEILHNGKFILCEIQSGKKIQDLLNDYKHDLENLEWEFYHDMSPRAIRFDNVKYDQTPIQMDSKANVYLSDIMNLEKDIRYLQRELDKRNSLYKKVIEMYDGREKEFIQDYVCGKYKVEYLKMKYCETNPYKKIIQLLGKVKY